MRVEGDHHRELFTGRSHRPHSYDHICENGHNRSKAHMQQWVPTVVVRHFLQDQTARRPTPTRAVSELQGSRRWCRLARIDPKAARAQH
jgi:hypothetical protein